jgi:hypothetical protein
VPAALRQPSAATTMGLFGRKKEDAGASTSSVAARATTVCVRDMGARAACWFRGGCDLLS